MELWLDIHLSPSIGRWIAASFGTQVKMMRDIGFRTATDPKVFFAARAPGTCILTKDSDFAELVEKNGPPPHILLLKCGNTSNSRLRTILGVALPRAIDFVRAGAALVYIEDPEWPSQ